MSGGDDAAAGANAAVAGPDDPMLRQMQLMVDAAVALRDAAYRIAEQREAAMLADRRAVREDETRQARYRALDLAVTYFGSGNIGRTVHSARMIAAFLEGKSDAEIVAAGQAFEDAWPKATDSAPSPSPDAAPRGTDGTA